MRGLELRSVRGRQARDVRGWERFCLPPPALLGLGALGVELGLPFRRTARNARPLGRVGIVRSHNSQQES